MALPYDRKFNIGRQSEQLFNEELHKLFEALKHIIDMPENNAVPHAKLHGALWLDTARNELKTYDKQKNIWKPIFENKFRLIDQIMDDLPPTDPLPGQLWLNNGILMFFDGVSWEPVKAMTTDSSQINIAAFEDFILLSPLWEVGNAVVDDVAIEEWRRFVLEGKLDPKNNSEFVTTDDKWNPLWQMPIQEPDEPLPIPPNAKAQFIIPNVSVDRFFIDGLLKNDYQKISNACIQYSKTALEGKTPALSHVNPGKITSIKKRLIKIDRDNPKILVSAHNTEFYGFRKDEISGRLLLPGKEQNEGDYVTTPDGIILSYNASQNFDYVLAVTFEFSWIKSVGRLHKTTNSDTTSSFYIARWATPLNVFVEGYDLEDRYLNIDGQSQVVTINTDSKGLEVSVLNSIKHEYGYIRDTDLNARGIIKLLGKFTHPLVFVNGEAIHPSLGNVEINDDKIYVGGAQRNMAWCVIDLYDATTGFDMFYKADIVTDTLPDGTTVILYDPTKIEPQDGIVLFVNGLLIKKEDIERDCNLGIIKTPGLAPNQDYILLHDKYHRLYDAAELIPAMVTGRINESLVYMNGKLLCNDTAVVTLDKKDDVKKTAANGEIKLFITSELNRVNGEWNIYDSYQDAWLPLDTNEINALSTIVRGYENTPNAVKFNLPYTENDEIIIYGYNFANHIDNPLLIRSFTAYNEDTFNIPNTYIPNIGALSVWVNGVRQYRVQEFLDGSGFKLPEKVTGKITYIIEMLEKGNAIVCEREILTKDNIVQGSANVYRTNKSLYPGRVTVYAGGLRLPKEAWTILDNNTIVIKDNKTLLIGHDTNYPEEYVQTLTGEIKKIARVHSDEILVEVRQEFMRTEQTILWQETNNWDIDITKYHLPRTILEAADEILIFVNGAFTGLACNTGYKKDKLRQCISILDGDIVNIMCTDPLYTFLQTNHAKRIKYKNKYGTDYVPKINNMITLEWR